MMGFLGCFMVCSMLVSFNGVFACHGEMCDELSKQQEIDSGCGCCEEDCCDIDDPDGCEPCCDVCASCGADASCAGTTCRISKWVRGLWEKDKKLSEQESNDTQDMESELESEK